jgi:hypothetical protein
MSDKKNPKNKASFQSLRLNHEFLIQAQREMQTAIDAWVKSKAENKSKMGR